VETREIKGLRAHGQGPSRAHFGFGEETFADHLEIRWPDGHVSRTENVPLRRHVLVRHPDAEDGSFGSQVEAKPLGDEEDVGEGMIKVFGQVYDMVNNTALEGVQVWEEHEPETIVTTDSFGQFSIPLRKGMRSNLVATEPEAVEMVLPVHPTYQTSPSEGILFPLMRQEQLETRYLLMSGEAWDPKKSTVIVYLKDTNQSPAVGTQVSLDAEYSIAMSVGPTTGTEGTVLLEGDMAILFFDVNVEASEVQLSAFSASGDSCEGHPYAPTRAKQVTVIHLYCP
jgi:hypothetical protein